MSPVALASRVSVPAAVALKRNVVDGEPITISGPVTAVAQAASPNSAKPADGVPATDTATAATGFVGLPAESRTSSVSGGEHTPAPTVTGAFVKPRRFGGPAPMLSSWVAAVSALPCACALSVAVPTAEPLK